MLTNIDQQFAQVRRFMEGFIPGMRIGDMEPCPTGSQALAALSVIERHVQDMETALDILWTKYLLPLTDEEKALVLAALPAREKGTE